MQLPGGGVETDAGIALVKVPALQAGMGASASAGVEEVELEFARASGAEGEPPCAGHLLALDTNILELGLWLPQVETPRAQRASGAGWGMVASEVADEARHGSPVSGAPAILTARRQERYRLPRDVKARLLSGFYGDLSASPRTLLVVAHQDDESIGAGARLARLADTWVVHVTDGAPPDPQIARRYGHATREAYAAARGEEASDALALAGVPAERQIGLGIMDGEACRRLAELCKRVAELVDAIEPDIVVTHPYEGGHTDHDSTAFAVHLAAGVLRREGRHPPAVVELTSYNGYGGEKVLQQFIPHARADRARRTIVLAREDRSLKRRMFACFHSQQTLLRGFDPGCETFRPAPRYIFTRPPHPGRLNYERYGNPALGREWRELASAALCELKLRQH